MRRAIVALVAAVLLLTAVPYARTALAVSITGGDLPYVVLSPDDASGYTVLSEGAIDPNPAFADGYSRTMINLGNQSILSASLFIAAPGVSSIISPADIGRQILQATAGGTGADAGSFTLLDSIGVGSDDLSAAWTFTQGGNRFAAYADYFRSGNLFGLVVFAVLGDQGDLTDMAYWSGYQYGKILALSSVAASE